MAIAPTGAIYKSLSFDGEDSRNYGVYITGEAVYNAPERDVEMITIPGRNGSFALDNGRFQNIEVSYPAGIFADTEANFRQAVSDFRNFLCSRKGYVRLQDEYNPDEYRMAVYKSGLEVDPAMLKAGEFTITFDCKPQRWLTSGESEVAVDSGDTLLNPTLFESKPLLEVEGYGSIGFNGYVIEISSAEAQTIPIAESEQYSYVNSVSFNFDETAFNTGDTIQINGGALTGLAGINGNQVYISSASDSDNRFSTTYNGYSASTTNFETITFNVGTYTEIVDTTTFLCLTDGSKTLKRDIKIKYTTGNITITVSTRPDSDAGMLWGTIRINQYGITGYSSKTSSMFIDCDLGEAYKVVDGEIISLNSYIDLGSDLPKLASGANTITFDNTITDLKITPRWQKV